VLTRDLAAVGVTVRVVDGEPYDAELYEPVGFEPTGDPKADLRVAETVRVGVVDHGTVVRVPEVIVYRHMEDGHGG
jgi:adenylylsulfate kinase-like enzyme